MDDINFLDFPLEKGLYTTKPKQYRKKPPLRVLITEARSGISSKLIYKISTGDVFGPDQEVILHLVNSRGSIHHGSILLELEECGFETLVGSVISSKPEKVYRKVDCVILVALFEELAGRSPSTAFISQVYKAHLIARNMLEYSKPDAKLVICSPSTKGLVILMTFLAKLCPNLNRHNVSGVTMMDMTLAKAILAKKLRTTTNKIKNVTIWGTTWADTFYTTFKGQVPGDYGNFGNTVLPLNTVVKEDLWMTKKFIGAINNRYMTGNIGRQGKAVAMAAAEHLRILFQGTHLSAEIQSMAIIISGENSYDLPPSIGVSVPVITSNTKVYLRQNMGFTINCQLMLLRCIYNLVYDSSITHVRNLLERIVSRDTKEILERSVHEGAKVHTNIWNFIITPTEQVDEPISTKINWYDRVKAASNITNITRLDALVKEKSRKLKEDKKVKLAKT